MRGSRCLVAVFGISSLVFAFNLLAGDAPKKDYLKDLKQSTTKIVKDVEKKSDKAVKEVSKSTKEVGKDLKKGVNAQKTKGSENVKDAKKKEQGIIESGMSIYHDLKKKVLSKLPKGKAQTPKK